MSQIMHSPSHLALAYLELNKNSRINIHHLKKSGKIHQLFCRRVEKTTWKFKKVREKLPKNNLNQVKKIQKNTKKKSINVSKTPRCENKDRYLCNIDIYSKLKKAEFY